MNPFDFKKYKEQELLKIKTKIEKDHLKLKILILQVGENEASNRYIKNKIHALEKVEITYIHKKYQENVTQETIEKDIQCANEDATITGIIVQLPLPKTLNEQEIIQAVDPKKDIDGLTIENQKHLLEKKETIIPCTVQGIMELLDLLKIDLEGKNIVILNRSQLIGIPLFFLLLEKNATVRVLHSKIKNIRNYTKQADIIISAVGKKKEFITKKDIKKGSIIIDAATIVEGNKLYGDVSKKVAKKASFVTPVPYGIGQLTVLELVKNTLKAYKMQKNITDK